jgi:uncharacterized protein (DUF58 family)
LVDDVSRFRTYRDFQAGDSLSRVSAAAWARSGFPQVRTYDRTAARPTVVVVDLRAAGYPLRLRWALIEAAVETAASLVWALLGQGETLWLNVIDRGGEGRPAALGPCRGWGEARLFLERLALAMPDKAEELVPCFLPIFPSSAARILWVGPAGRDPPPMTYEVVRFPIEEDGVHDLISPS